MFYQVLEYLLADAIFSTSVEIGVGHGEQTLGRGE